MKSRKTPLNGNGNGTGVLVAPKNGFTPVWRPSPTRNVLTDEWKDRGIQGREYGILTNTVHQGTFDVSVGEHKNLKGLEKGDLRDHMTPRELAFTILGEDLTTSEIRKRDAQGFRENLEAAEDGGQGAGKLRRQFEELTGEPVVSGDAFLESGENTEPTLPEPDDEDTNTGV